MTGPEVGINIYPKETTRRREVEHGYRLAILATETFFGEGKGLLPESVKKVVIKDSLNRPGSIIIKYGIWHPDSRTIVLATDANSSVKEFAKSYYHELGHAFETQVLAKRGGRSSRDKSIVGKEAFAEWIGLIIAANGSKWKVNEQLKPYIQGDDAFDLHGTIRDGAYPTEVGKLRDAALYNYIYHQCGLDVLLGLYGSDSNKMGNRLDRLSMRFDDKLALQVPDVIRNMVLNGRRFIGIKRSESFRDKISYAMGTSSIQELVGNARNWYGR